MAKDGRKAAVGLGIAGGIAGLIYLTTRAEAKPPPGKANLYGKVTDAVTGKKISDVLVTLNGMQIYTDAAGNYAFINLEPGGYVIQFSKEGYQSATY